MADLLPLTCVIVDDNEMSRLALEHFVALTPGLELAATLPDGLTALQFLQTHPPIDLLLLDIEMPHLTGLELIRILSQPLPAIVLVTSHHSFAAEAFELPVADYLVKPVDYARFLRAVKQVRALRPAPAPPLPAPENSNVFAKVNGRLVRINFDEVYYIEALSTYSVLVTATHKHIVHLTLKSLEERLPFSHFVRVHRSYIVNTRLIDAIDDHQLTLGPYTVPVGKLHKAELMRRLAPL
ncbi:response regulator transcription factor [Microvirga sp. STS02]|uniref:LytR/AlgR family response regulator transcription factor n=1 Tax=Hymenobacter negativus TaxID=2795026 RepID=UPI0018DD3E8A|nr:MULTISPECIES: LytTR family DNA-binding domain-containing protein [Bacteria]MBH8570662.1 response regulator transcription factor [Hymenobacter negativus]MBR7210400.1 response regulator transcription factor [Microvirga sp. STS02]